MKTSFYNKKNLMKALMVFASAMTLAAFTACGKNGGDSPPPPPVVPVGPVYGQCTNCPAGSALLASGTGNTYYQNQLQGNINLEFYGSGVTNQAGGQYQQTNYYGSVSAQGTMIWQIPSLMCGLQQGTYSVTTTQAGSWQGQSFYNLVLQLNGPTQATVYANGWISAATPALIGLDGRQYPYQVVGQFRVMSTSNGGSYPYGGGGGCYLDFINMY
ncbi:MAG: hypothetical protein AAB250_15230 [Bdellovibrionota bacterium]